MRPRCKRRHAARALRLFRPPARAISPCSSARNGRMGHRPPVAAVPYPHPCSAAAWADAAASRGHSQPAGSVPCKPMVCQVGAGWVRACPSEATREQAGRGRCSGRARPARGRGRVQPPAGSRCAIAGAMCLPSLHPKVLVVMDGITGNRALPSLQPPVLCRCFCFQLAGQTLDCQRRGPARPPRRPGSLVDDSQQVRHVSLHPLVGPSLHRRGVVGNHDGGRLHGTAGWCQVAPGGESQQQWRWPAQVAAVGGSEERNRGPGHCQAPNTEGGQCRRAGPGRMQPAGWVPGSCLAHAGGRCLRAANLGLAQGGADQWQNPFTRCPAPPLAAPIPAPFTPTHHPKARTPAAALAGAAGAARAPRSQRA